ncbi:hypothetical protein DFH09DRAFT_1319117 [Mycena vulgaris]|nr:hypothetical protein DFH09DRAFT_1319117 [Mycena vulgaris]
MSLRLCHIVVHANRPLDQLPPDSAVYFPCIPSFTTFWSHVCFPSSFIVTLLICFLCSPPTGDRHLPIRHASGLLHLAPVLGNPIGGMIELLLVAQLPYLSHQDRWVTTQSSSGWMLVLQVGLTGCQSGASQTVLLQRQYNQPDLHWRQRDVCVEAFNVTDFATIREVLCLKDTTANAFCTTEGFMQSANATDMADAASGPVGVMLGILLFSADGLFPLKRMSKGTPLDLENFKSNGAGAFAPTASLLLLAISGLFAVL